MLTPGSISLIPGVSAPPRRDHKEEGMIVALYIAAAVITAAGSLYLTWRSVDFRKFLAGAFLVSSGILFYLYLAAVSVPLLGTNVVFTCGAAPGSDGGSIGMARTCKNETFPSATTGRSADELEPHLELIARLRRIGSPVREVADFDGSLENGSYVNLSQAGFAYPI